MCSVDTPDMPEMPTMTVKPKAQKARIKGRKSALSINNSGAAGLRNDLEGFATFAKPLQDLLIGIRGGSIPNAPRTQIGGSNLY